MAKQRKKVRGKSNETTAPAAKRTPDTGTLMDGFEWSLPAGFTSDGARMATLKEVLDPTIPTRSMLQLSEDHRFDLVAKRVELRPSAFSLQIPLHGRIGKARAIAEIRSRTKIGMHLAEIEEMIMKQCITQWRKTR
jgi:hypothetical protein